MSTKQDLSGRVVAVTGAARGIGLATATAAHARGATVVLGDVDEAAAQTAAETLGARAYGAAVDVSDADSFAAFVLLAQEHGPIDVLVNNAGIMPIGPFTEQSAATHRRTVEVNVLGVINGAYAVLPGMVARGHGQVINVASTAGRAPVPGGATYCATKAAVLAFTETTRVEYAGTGVTFTAVVPHFTNSDLITGTNATKGVPVVEPGDVAEAICAAIERPRPDVYVPASMRGMLAVQPLLGRRLRDGLNRRLGAYSAFLDVDARARAGYDDRIARS
jgi:NADP-dependent 3-hydroxy acid dehydrogenase YdfG